MISMKVFKNALENDYLIKIPQVIKKIFLKGMLKA